MSDHLFSRDEAHVVGSVSQDHDFTRRFEKLYRDHNAALVGLLYQKLHSHMEASEVAQEAYARLFQLDKPGNIRILQAWLFRTALNLAADRLRKRRVRERDAHLLCDLGEARSPSAEQLVLEEEERACIQRAVQELPPKCRQAFTLVQFHGLEYAQVAAEMDATEVAVRQLVCRAVEHLAKAVAGRGRARQRRVGS